MSAELDLLLAELDALPNPATPPTAQDWEIYKDVMIRMDKNHTRRNIHEQLKLRGFITSLPTVHQRLESWGHVKNNSKKRKLDEAVDLTNAERHQLAERALVLNHTKSGGELPVTTNGPINRPNRFGRSLHSHPIVKPRALQAASSPLASRPLATAQEHIVGRRFLSAASNWFDDLVSRGMLDDASWRRPSEIVYLLSDINILVHAESYQAGIRSLRGKAIQLSNAVKSPTAQDFIYYVRHFNSLARNCSMLAKITTKFISEIVNEQLGDQHPMAQAFQALCLEVRGAETCNYLFRILSHKMVSFSNGQEILLDIPHVDILIGLDLLEQAEEIIESALHVSKECTLPPWQQFNYLMLSARICMLRGDLEKAEQALYKAWELERDLSHAAAADILYHHSHICWAVGDMRGEEHYLRLALQRLSLDDQKQVYDANRLLYVGELHEVLTREGKWEKVDELEQQYPEYYREEEETVVELAE